MRPQGVILVLLLVGSGCGRIGFDALARPERRVLDEFSTDSSAFVPFEGLTIPRSSDAASWLVVASGALRWNDGARAPEVEVRLLVGGEERGLAGCTGLHGTEGPFSLFDVVDASRAPVDVAVEIRSGGDIDGSVEGLRLIAVPLRAEATCASALPALQPNIEGPLLTLDVQAGSFFVMAQLALEDTGGGDVSFRLADPDGAPWPAARRVQHGRRNVQSHLLSRRFLLASPGTFSMETRVSGGDEARMAHARICALPLSAFGESQAFVESAESTSTATATPTVVQRLELRDAPAGRYLLVQGVAAWTPALESRTTEVSIRRDGGPLLDVSLNIDQAGLTPTYGVIDVIDVDGPATFTTLVSESTMGDEVRAFEANTYVFEL